MFPNGRKNASGHYVSIFLMSQASVNVKIEYELFVVSQLEQKWESYGLSFSIVPIHIFCVYFICGPYTC